MDQYFYKWFYQQSELMLSHNKQFFHTKLSGNQTVFIFSNMLFWIDSHIFIIWIVWNWNAFLVYVFSHIELFFYSFNPNSNPVDFVSRIDLLDAFTDPWLFPESIY